MAAPDPFPPRMGRLMFPCTAAARNPLRPFSRFSSCAREGEGGRQQRDPAADKIAGIS